MARVSAITMGSFCIIQCFFQQESGRALKRYKEDAMDTSKKQTKIIDTLKGILPQGLKHVGFKVRKSLGLTIPIRTDDRRVLEQIVIPYLSTQRDTDKVLFVGCEWYTQHYKKFFVGKKYWTIDFDPSKTAYGSRGHHIVDSLENIDKYFAGNYFDVIICNGVFGWGLNTKEQTKNAFGGCYKLLRPGGYFVLGWNDIPQSKPFHPEECTALRQFNSYIFPPLGATQYIPITSNGHTFNFYVK
jgi:SAM-dependent methyltransferase